jgi:nitroreductase
MPLKTAGVYADSKKDPVPKEILHKVLEAAVRAPSGMNTQPWEFIVASGKVLDEIREECGRLFVPAHHPHQRYAAQPLRGSIRQRQVDLAIEIFKIVGIKREDKDGRHKWMLRGMRFFESPARS